MHLAQIFSFMPAFWSLLLSSYFSKNHAGKIGASLATSSLKQPNGIHWCHLHFHISHKVAISPYGKTHQPVLRRFIAGWLLVHWRWSHLKITDPSTHGRLTVRSETRHGKSNLSTFQHWYLADMLASVCSYRVMVKSISCCCVRQWKTGSLKSSHILLTWPSLNLKS